SAPANQKECTWCKKHSPGRHLSHAWHECNKLKAHNESKKKGDTKPAKQEESHITTGIQLQEKVRIAFYFDTCASSHMVPTTDRFSRFQVCGGTVKSSATTTMEIKGKGSVLLDCALRDGSFFFVLFNSYSHSA